MIKHPVVVMGVAGCGKSSLGVAIAEAEGAQLIEGDAYHSDANREKMRRGIALTDADRAGWLDIWAGDRRVYPGNVVLTCSALKLAYRERLRAAAPGLRFVFMEIDPASARARVEARDAHFFSPSLVASQFRRCSRRSASRVCCGSMRLRRWRNCKRRSVPGCTARGVHKGLGGSAPVPPGAGGRLGPARPSRFFRVDESRGSQRLANNAFSSAPDAAA